jgi:hypothetical protein
LQFRRAISKAAVDFQLEEFKALRAEILALMAANDALEKYAGIATAGVLTWLLTTKGISPEMKTVGWLIPPLIAGVAGLRAKVYGIRLAQIGDYIRERERDLGIIGWETRLRKSHEVEKEKEAIAEEAVHQSEAGPSATFRFSKWMIKILDTFSKKWKVAYLPVERWIGKEPVERSARLYWGHLLVISLVLSLIGLITSFVSDASPDNVSTTIGWIRSPISPPDPA